MKKDFLENILNLSTQNLLKQNFQNLFRHAERLSLKVLERQVVEFLNHHSLKKRVIKK